MEYDSEVIQDYFSGITLVDTLTVTRALVGLSRLNPEANAEKSMWERRASLSKKRLDWTTAVQTIGEGIFIELDGRRLEEAPCSEQGSPHAGELVIGKGRNEPFPKGA